MTGTMWESEEREYAGGVKLYGCVPMSFRWMPKFLRLFLGWLYLMIFTTMFLIVPITLCVALPFFWTPERRIYSMIYLGMIGISLLLPLQEWPFMRKFGQLMYEVLDISCNLSTEERIKCIAEAESKHLITGMHPHGIVPFQAVIWASVCEQYLTDWETGKSVYGFGAAANAVYSIPFLRNLMGWLSAGNATYATLKNGLEKGKSPTCNRAGRKPRHLFLFPGGIAEVFTSQIGQNSVVFKKRRGLIKLSIETGAELVPSYVFGGTDFFHNLATGKSWLSELSRKLKMGLTWFWGRFGLPIPYHPKITVAIGNPIPIPEGWDGKSDIPEALIEQLHEAYITELQRVFETYKGPAGLPESATLEVQ